MSKVFFNRGFTLLKIGRSSEAKKSFEKAINILYGTVPVSLPHEMDIADAWYQIELICHEFGNKDKFEFAKEQVLVILQKVEDIDTSWKQGLVRFNEPKLVKEFFEMAFGDNPRDATFWKNKGFNLLILSTSNQLKNDATSWKHKGFNLVEYLSLQQEKIDKKDEHKILGDALEAFDRSIKINSRDSEAWANKGFVEMQLGKYYESLKSVKKALEINPDSGEAWFNRGLVCLHIEHYKEATESFQNSIIIFEKELQINPESLSVLYNCGLAFYYLGEYQDSCSYFEKVVEINESYKDTLYLRGLIFNKLGKYDKAIDYFGKCITDEQKKAYSYINRGIAYREIGEHKKAVEDFKKLIKDYEEAKKSSNQKILADAYANKSISLWTQKMKKHFYLRPVYKYLRKFSRKFLRMLSEPHKNFDDAINTDEKVSLNVLNNEALCSVANNDYSKAHKKFDEAISFYPFNYEARYWKGIIYYYQRKYINAKWEFGKAIKIFEKRYPECEKYKKSSRNTKDDFEQRRLRNVYANLFYRKGICTYYSCKYSRISGYEEAREYEEALGYLKNAIKMNPEHLDAYNYKAITLYDMERYEESKKCLEESLSKSDANTLGKIYLGKFLLNLGDVEEAEEKLRSALFKVEDKDTSSLIQCLRGMIYFKKEKYNEAINYFNSAISLDPLAIKHLIWKNYAKYLSLESSFENFEENIENRKTSGFDKSISSEQSIQTDSSKKESSKKLKKEFYLGINSIIRDLETASTFYKISEDNKLEEYITIRAYILYFMGCLYYKTDKFLAAKQKFEECIKLSTSPEFKDLKKSAQDLLKNIEECKVKPPFWEWWWSSSTSTLWRKSIFPIILLSIFFLIAFHPVIYDFFLYLSIRFMKSYFVEVYSNLTTAENLQNLLSFNWNIYILAIILLIIILLLPSIRQIAGQIGGQGVTIQMEKTEPIASFHLPMPPFRFEDVDIREFKKSSQMFIPPARKLTTKWAPVYPEFLELDLWE